MGTFKSEKHDAEAIAVKGVSLLIFCRALDPSPTRVGLFRQFRLCGAAMELGVFCEPICIYVLFFPFLFFLFEI